MVGTYPTGWHSLTIYGTVGPDLVYPDPFEAGTKPATVDFGTLTVGESVFAAGDKDAVIRGIWMLRDIFSTAPSIVIMNKAGTRRFWQSLTAVGQSVSVMDCNILVPTGFYVDITSGSPFCSIYYEINAKG